MKCLNCGERVTSNQTFCIACGKVNIICPKCRDLVSGEDAFCGKCGCNLSEVISNAKKLQANKEAREKEEYEKKIEEKKQAELKVEMKEYASNLIIDCEGNKFKAIKEFKEKFEVDNDVATKFINEAYNKVNDDEEPEVQSVQTNSNSIEEIVKRNNYQASQSIKEVREIYGYEHVEAKNIVDAVINNSKVTNEYVNPKGIKKVIIVSQSSRKKATSAIGRGLIGGAILGPVGLLAGASAKSKETTTFQVIYNSGKQETVTVKNGSWMFKEYCKYLDN